MYGKEDGQILLSGISVKKGGYAKNLPDGGGEYTQFCRFFFGKQGYLGPKNTILMLFWFIFRPFGQFLTQFRAIATEQYSATV